MERYELSAAVAPFVAFIDELTNWYIRRCRPRFWSEEDSLDRREAFETLYFVLFELSKIAAPFVPFLSDAIYQELRRREDPLSVHLTDYPTYDLDRRDERLEHQMALVQRAASLGHSLRKEHKVKVRQPLAKVYLISADESEREALGVMMGLVCDELNVKEAEILADESRFVTLVIKPNFRTLGKKAGSLLAYLKDQIANLSRKEQQTLLKGDALMLTVNGTPFELLAEDVLIERHVIEGLVALCEGNLTVALDLTLNEELLKEGIAREIVNKVNTMRRSQNFEVTDRIRVIMQASNRVKEAFEVFEGYITGEILAKTFAFASCDGEEWDLNGESVKIRVEKL
jgi:isoleucyl-tRNA synthetase